MSPGKTVLSVKCCGLAKVTFDQYTESGFYYLEVHHGDMYCGRLAMDPDRLSEMPGYYAHALLRSVANTINVRYRSDASHGVNPMNRMVGYECVAKWNEAAKTSLAVYKMLGGL